VARSGVITAAAVAGELALPLDVLVICRLETPGHQDLTMGALGPDDVRILDRDLVKAMQLRQSAIASETRRQWLELRRRQRLYREDRLPLDVFGKSVIVVDDGIDSGATINVALSIIHRHHAAHVVVAVPVAPPRECVRLRSEADAFLCLYAPEPFFGIRYWYGDFRTVSDPDVRQAIARSRRPVALAVV
jgi:putative phosphoribosyl transferase